MQALKLALQNNCNIPFSLGKELGQGADGQCFEVQDNPKIVIKISAIYNDSIRYNITKKIIKYMIYNQPYLYAQVYSYKHLGEFLLPNNDTYILYYYVMKKLNKISEDESKVFHTLISHEDKNIIKNYSPAQLNKILLGLQRGLDFDPRVVTLFYNKLQNSRIVHNDLHVRNVMKDETGNFRLIDFDRCNFKKTSIP